MSFWYGLRAGPWGVLPFDCLRKRFSRLNGFRGFNGGGAAHKNIEAPQSFEYMVFTKDGNPVNLLNL